MPLRRVHVVGLVVLMAAGFAQGRPLSVPNATFDPLLSPAGRPPFDAILDENVPSPLGRDYWIVQRAIRLSDDWRNTLESSGATVTAIFPLDATLVVVAEGQGPGLGLLPTVSWDGRYRPSYKVHEPLAALFTGGGHVAPRR